MLQSKIEALIKINKEISERCAPKPVLSMVHSNKSRELIFSWKWKPKVNKLDQLLDKLRELGPFSFKLRNLEQVWPLIQGFTNSTLEQELLSLLEEYQTELGKLESKCIAAHVENQRLPTHVTHPYMVTIVCPIKCSNALGLANYLLTCPEAEVIKTHSHRNIACSWLALKLFGQQTISHCQRIGPGLLREGIYMYHDSKRFTGLALRNGIDGRRLIKFNFDQLELFCFGNLQLDQSETKAKSLTEITDDPILLSQTMYYPLG